MTSSNSSQTVFREEQAFRQVWIWVIILPISLMMWFFGIEQILLNQQVGQRPMPDLLLIIFWLLFGLGLPVMFFMARLITEVRRDGLYIRFIPFHFSEQKIPFTDIIRCQARTYRPIIEYGGWGIRYGLKGKAYNVSGNQGVQLELADGRQLLIGSARSEALHQVLEAQIRQYRK